MLKNFWRWLRPGPSARFVGEGDVDASRDRSDSVSPIFGPTSLLKTDQFVPRDGQVISSLHFYHAAVAELREGALSSVSVTPLSDDGMLAQGHDAIDDGLPIERIPNPFGTGGDMLVVEPTPGHRIVIGSSRAGKVFRRKSEGEIE